jgi:hypothetical protein
VCEENAARVFHQAQRPLLYLRKGHGSPIRYPTIMLEYESGKQQESWRARHVLCLVGLSLCALCCAGKANIPDIPSLDELGKEYDRPTASLDTLRARDALASIPEVANLDRLDAGFYSARTVADSVEDAKEPAEEQTGEGVQLRGSLRITIRCPGDLGNPVYDVARNGSVVLTVALSRSKVRRTIIGTATRCQLGGKLGSLPISVELDGTLAFDLGRDVPLGGTYTPERVLLSLQGSITVGDVVFDGVSARVDDQGVEHLFQLPDGSVVVSVTDSGFSVRGRNGSWSCSKEDGTCAAL